MRNSLVAVVYLLAVTAAIAQPTKVVEDRNVGVRLKVPQNWTSSGRGNDLFIDCAPDKNDQGRPECYFTIRRVVAPDGQKAITEADRATWDSWATAKGMRKVLSTKDITVAGFPAHEIVVKTGAYRLRRVMILVPGKGEVFDSSFIAMGKNDKDEYDAYNPAFAAALATLVPIE